MLSMCVWNWDRCCFIKVFWWLGGWSVTLCVCMIYHGWLDLWLNSCYISSAGDIASAHAIIFQRLYLLSAILSASIYNIIPMKQTNNCGLVILRRPRRLLRRCEDYITHTVYACACPFLGIIEAFVYIQCGLYHWVHAHVYKHIHKTYPAATAAWLPASWWCTIVSDASVFYMLRNAQQISFLLFSKVVWM